MHSEATKVKTAHIYIRLIIEQVVVILVNWELFYKFTPHNEINPSLLFYPCSMYISCNKTKEYMVEEIISLLSKRWMQRCSYNYFKLLSLNGEDVNL